MNSDETVRDPPGGFTLVSGSCLMMPIWWTRPVRCRRKTLYKDAKNGKRNSQGIQSILGGPREFNADLEGGGGRKKEGSGKGRGQVNKIPAKLNVQSRQSLLMDFQGTTDKLGLNCSWKGHREEQREGEKEVPPRSRPIP